MSAIDRVIPARPRDIGGFAVRRSIPSVQRRAIGPFVFLDHMGPADLAPGEGMDVRPHPHIELATVTYLFEGEVDHRDSLGSFQTIRPGDVNWMLAGTGIVHSERTGPDARRRGTRVHGVQSWVALPTAHELDAPRFDHHPSTTIPRIERDGATLEIVAGESYGARSPVRVLSPTLYVHARLERGARLPIDDAHEARAVYVVEGAVMCDGDPLAPGMLAVLHAGAHAELVAAEASRVMLVGGARLDGERHIDWNFVSSSKERIEKAKADWRAQNERFAKVPGDDREHVPLPERTR